jgi:hypothetical protein
MTTNFTITKARGAGSTLRIVTFSLMLLGAFISRVFTRGDVIVAASLLVAVYSAVTLPLDRRSFRVSLPALAVVLWVTASVLWSVVPATTERRVASCGVLAVASSLLGAMMEPEDLRTAISFACRVTVAASLAMAVIAPGWAISPPDQNAPGMLGVTAQKNQLGFIICLGLAAEGLGMPSKTRKFWFITYLGAVLLTQSSTAIAVAFLTAGLFGLLSTVARIPDRAGKTLLVLAWLTPGAILVFLG